MKLKIGHKLFFAFALTSAAIVALMVVLMKLSIDRGFVEYVNQAELARLEPLVEELELAYAEHGSWDFLRHNIRAWHELLSNQGELPGPPRVGTRPGPPPPGGAWPRLEPDGQDGLRPRPSEGQGFGPPPRPEGEPPFPGADGRRPAPPEDPMGLGPRLMVLDEQRQHVIGRPGGAGSAVLEPIRRGDSVVGYLGIRQTNALTDQLDIAFLEQQVRAFYLIAGIAIALSGLVAFLIARHLVAPVQQLTDGTLALTSGDFDTRIDVITEDELGQLARDFNTLAVTLGRNEQYRRQWVADTSHELRTPLAVLRAEIEAMQDGVRPPARATFDSLHAEVMQLAKLVDDLYELSRSDIGALAYHKQDLDPAPLLEQVVAGYEERFGAQRIELELELELDGRAGAQVHADGDRLRQLFSNLLENSLRYTDADGRLRVTMRRRDGELIVEFSDTTPGVSSAALPKLFDRFFRVDASRRRAEGGSGLGLAICKNIVEAHGGAIEAGPSPLGGLTIRVSLPCLRG